MSCLILVEVCFHLCAWHERWINNEHKVVLKNIIILQMIQNGTLFLLSDKVKTADTDQYAETVFPIQPTLAHVVCQFQARKWGKY